MNGIFTATILGIVEGLTEFLPVSSTGHLIISGHLLDFTGQRASIFEVVIQLGAILAVLVLYRERFWGLLQKDPQRNFSGLQGIWLLVLTSIPASILGFLSHSFIKEYLFTPQTVAWALGIGALAIILVEALPRSNRFSSLDEVTPFLAFGIGCFQCLALWPGFSRSAATIMGGMILGARRKLAAEYSFIAAVPIMFAATGYDLLKGWPLLQAKDFTLLSIGFGVSFIAAWFAVKGFIHLLSRMTLRPFAYYRLIIAPIILLATL